MVDVAYGTNVNTTFYDTDNHREINITGMPIQEAVELKLLERIARALERG